MLFKNPNLLQEALEYKENNEGICYLLSVLSKQGLITNEEAQLTSYFIRQYLRDINRYSGNYVYPIACTTDHEMFTFQHHQENETLWDESNEYGRTRCELFEAIINNINANREEPSDGA